MGLTSQHAARFLLDTTSMGIYEEDGTTEVQPVISLLEPFTGFENKQVMFTKTSHATLLNEAMCVIPQLDGHNEHKVAIALIPKSGDPAGGDAAEGLPGSFESAFDFELKCDAGHCSIEKTTKGQFYQVSHLANPIAFLLNLFSTFWTGSDPPDSCVNEGSSATSVPCDPDVEDCTYCDISGYCYKVDGGEPNRWECDGDVPAVDSHFNVAVNQTVDMQKGFNNLNIALESFMLPSPMRVANEMSGFGIIDSQSDSELTQNNEDGFGGLMQTVKSDPSDMVDKLRELVRMPTAIYND